MQELLYEDIWSICGIIQREQSTNPEIHQITSKQPRGIRNEEENNRDYTKEILVSKDNNINYNFYYENWLQLSRAKTSMNIYWYEEIECFGAVMNWIEDISLVWIIIATISLTHMF